MAGNTVSNVVREELVTKSGNKTTTRVCEQTSIKKSLLMTSDQQAQQALSEFLLKVGVPFNVVDCPEWRTFFKTARGNTKAQSLTRDAYNSDIDSYHALFQELVSKKLLDEIASMYGFAFLNLIHDLWTNNSVNCVLGSSISFIDKHWLKVYIAMTGKVHKSGHSALNVSKAIKTRFKEDFPAVGIKDDIWTVVSDTTAAARYVADHFPDSSQNDCKMHAIQLAIKYSMGLVDNTVTIDCVVHIVTPGAEDERYDAAIIAISKLRKVVKFIGTPERRKNFVECAEEENFANYTVPGIDGDTRVADCHKIIQIVVFNYLLLKKYFQKQTAKDTEIFMCISEDEWILLIEMEAILQPIAVFARSTSQTASEVTASYFLIWKKDWFKHLEKTSFQVLTRSFRHIGETYKTQARESKERDSFSADSRPCFDRCKAQLKIRFENPQHGPNNVVRDDEDMFLATCVDPR
eukprot:15341889-Ditylum_brightwellii.AAC.1